MEPEQIETLAKEASAPEPEVHGVRLADLPLRAWSLASRRAVHRFVTDWAVDVAATLTAYAALSAFPALLALLTLLSLIGEGGSTVRWVLEFVGRVAPDDVVELLREPVTHLTQISNAGWVLAASLAVAVWGASGYVGAFGRAMNRIHRVAEGRPFWMIVPYNLAVTAAALLLSAVGVFALAASGRFVRFASSRLGVTLPAWIELVRWPALLVVGMVFSAGLYQATPNVKLGRIRWITPGSALAMATMVAAVLGFNLYLDAFDTFNATYGLVGSFLVLLLLLWIVNGTLVFGGVWDAELERARQLLAGVEAERDVPLPPRDTSAIRRVAAGQDRFVAEARRLREDATTRPNSG